MTQSPATEIETDSESIWDALWYNAQVATMCFDMHSDKRSDKRSDKASDKLGLINNGAIGVLNGAICWVGSSNDIPQAQLRHCNSQLDAQGRLVSPGLIDCHTHLVYAGSRAKEFEQRLNGVSYSDIAKAGGGIASTVSATRSSDKQELFDLAKQRLQSFLDEGVTTVEIKSGYGLDLENEIKMLKVARRLGEELPLDVKTSFLGAHATPPEFDGDNAAYIEHVCDEILPKVAQLQLADCVDAFCENIAFTAEQVNQVFSVAKGLDLPIKLHAEQLSDQKGAVMAAKMGALSVDHIEFLEESDVVHLKQNDTVAVLLPGAFYFLGETKLPPIAELRRQGVPIAIASDSNPGSSPVESLLLMLNMACTLFKLTPDEALAGVTINAAKALGIQHRVGTLEVGKRANIVLWDIHEPAELSYRIGSNPCNTVMFEGEVR